MVAILISNTLQHITIKLTDDLGLLDSEVSWSISEIHTEQWAILLYIVTLNITLPQISMHALTCSVEGTLSIAFWTTLQP